MTGKIQFTNSFELARDLIADLNSGMANWNGDRTSHYFVLAKEVETGKEITVSLIENVRGLAKKEQYYTVHVVDNINATPCELYDTATLSCESLVKLLENIAGDRSNYSMTFSRHLV